jgi:hypothetical protein
MVSSGDQLEELCSQACDEIILVAPFIKVSALERILSRISNESVLKCVTRWRLEEIVASVSDLEVWHLIESRPNSLLWLRADLHAKYYRADLNCLVGSANITAKALGWSSQSNLELLVPLPASNPQLLAFEQELFVSSVQVDQSIFEQMQKAVQLFKECYPEIQPVEFQSELNLEENTQQKTTSNMWLPTLRNPEDLYLAYSGRLEDLSSVGRQAALLDLQVFQLPQNLSKIAFQTSIGSLMLQMPIIHRVDSFLETPRRFGSVTELLYSLPCSQNPDFDADRAWQTLMRWLRYFLPDRYILSKPNHSEIFGKVK